jgi:hypothetical protein
LPDFFYKKGRLFSSAPFLFSREVFDVHEIFVWCS